MSDDASLPTYSNAKSDTNTNLTHTNSQKYHKASIQKNINIRLAHARNHDQIQDPKQKQSV